MQIPDPSRRAVLGGLAAGLGLTACGTSPTLELIGNAFSKKNVLGAGNAYPLTPDRIREIPYASMGVNIGGNEPGVLILAVGTAKTAGEDRSEIVGHRAGIHTPSRIWRPPVGTLVVRHQTSAFSAAQRGSRWTTSGVVANAADAAGDRSCPASKKIFPIRSASRNWPRY